ncbi:class I SAM-dependent methyltransferase [bacterium]|nr:class I SAM-dependent methyltransferase [bacterium]
MQWKDNLSPSSLEKLCAFTDLIVRWNSRINLTGYRTRQEIDDLLIGESVLAVLELQKMGIFKAGTTILDFGSGAGIPGLVWAMLKLPIEITSLEIRQKKIAFQKEVVRELGLQARIILGKFPEAVAGERFDLIVSRAIRFDPKIWEKGRVLLNPSGHFVRFAAANLRETGWESHPVSEKTSLQIST